jgi:hypothetical protein
MTDEPWLDYHSTGVPVAYKGLNRVSYTSRDTMARVQLSLPFREIVFKWVKLRVLNN